MVYFARINYALAVFAVTIGVTQFYTQMGELSSALLTTRVEETALGGGVRHPRRARRPAAAHGARGHARPGRLPACSRPGPRRPHRARPPGYRHDARTSTRILDASFNAASATLRPLTRTLLGTANPRCTRVPRLVDLSHELGRTSCTTAPRRALEPTSRSSPESPAALHRWPEPSHRACTGPRQPCRPFLPGQHRTAAPRQPTPATGSLRSEVEDIEAVARDPPNCSLDALRCCP